MLQTSPRLCCGSSRQNDDILWRVWAPRADRVDLLLPRRKGASALPMSAVGDGCFERREHLSEEVTFYHYGLDGGPLRPDPCSRWQPEGLTGPSALYFPGDYPWSDRAWKGLARPDLAFYELHVGTFTPEGTFEAIVPRLGALRDLGITAIELMPVGQFPGTRNWGYDGVLPYAAQNSYGGPRGLQRLVDAAHHAGLAVFLDVVYNHFGPEHNYLEEFGPYLTDRYQTPWGKAVNFDGPHSDPVRDFIVKNARMWLEDFHLDGLRLDAVHAIYDMSAHHILEEIAAETAAVSERTGVRRHIVAESDRNDPRTVRPIESGGYGIDAQWSDDFHHAVHAFLTRETTGYYTDFGERDHIARALNEPFIYAGHYSRHRSRRHGASARGISGDHFVVCIQNHDQIGNRAKGDRLSTLLPRPSMLRLAACLLLFAPHLPLIFMGEEYGEERPFPFFCSFCGEELVEAVRQGRRREFADFVARPEEIPDPGAADTFAAAQLSWQWPDDSRHAALRRLYTDLLHLRKSLPALRDYGRWAARLLDGREPRAILQLVRGARRPDDDAALSVFFNLTEKLQPLPAGVANIGAASWSSEAAHYGGDRGADASTLELLPFESVLPGISPDILTAGT